MLTNQRHIDWGIGFLVSLVAMAFILDASDYHSSHCKPRDQSNTLEADGTAEAVAHKGSLAQESQSTHGNKKVEHTTSEPSFACGVTGFRYAVVAYMDHHEGFFVGGFTFVLAVSTILLWRATANLYEAGERQLKLSTDTAQRQLRSYPGVKRAKIELSDEMVYAEIVVENHSPTPAYEFDWALDVGICDLDTRVSDDPPFRNLRWDMVRGAFTTLNVKRRINSNDRMAVVHGQKKIVVWGHVKYRDAFGKDQNRHIRFRYRHGNDLRVVEPDLVHVSEWLEPEEFHSN
ncbi:MAG: hypothetical protein K2X72_07815 [Reyranella sp.]|nr:hypothetical protein [Reyranella sp.]